jgi:hypothetical protein
MKHSHLVRVTRLSHPKAFELAFALSFGFRLGHPKAFELFQKNYTSSKD